MAGFGVAFVIPMLFLLPLGAVGASLGASDTVIRREGVKSARVIDRMSMTPRGELLQSKPDPKNLETVSAKQPRETLQDSPEGTVKFEDEMTDAEKRSRAVDFCDYDFPVGKLATNDCNETKGGTHAPIMSESMCIQAATEAGATVRHDNFVIISDLQLVRPKGCFQQPCDGAPDTMCYFFNGAGDTPGVAPDVILNTTAPVCHRNRYVDYLAPDTDTGDAGCPDGYERIPTEEPCRQVQTCLGKPAGNQFRIGMNNASRHKLYPYGCFVDKKDGKVYINEASRMGSGASVTGTLICKVIVSSRAGTTDSADSSTAAPTVADSSTAAPTVAP